MRIAILQCPPQADGVPAALDRLRGHAAEAASQGAALLVTPEMFLTGYNIGRDAVARMAEPADGPAMAQAGRIAAQFGIGLVVGYPERAASGAVHNAATLFGRDGSQLATYRKTHLYGEVDRAQFAPGPALVPPVRFDGWSLGLAICYDIEFPEVARTLAVQGAEAIVVPTANMTPFESICTRLVPARAEENAVYVAYANYCGEEGDFSYCGLSCLSGPDGEDLVRAKTGPELLFADLSREAFEAARRRATHLRDRRPELYGNLTPARPNDRP